jgi:hypothetical protein
MVPEFLPWFGIAIAVPLVIAMVWIYEEYRDDDGDDDDDENESGRLPAGV